MDNYIIGELIGEGTFGKVYRGVHKDTQKSVAIKVISNITFSNCSLIQLEAFILKKIKHPKIITLYEYISTENKEIFILEYTELGDFLEYFNKYNFIFNDTLIKHFFCQLTSAINYLHNLGYIHGDLKLDNILIFPNYLLKLTDFGFSIPRSSSHKMIVSRGSINYAAPEIYLRRSIYGPEIDIWSLGIILYIMIYGYLPFNLSGYDNKEIVKIYKSLEHKNIIIPWCKNQDIHSLIKLLLKISPYERITMKEILQSSWLNDSLVELPRSIKSEKDNSKLSFTNKIFKFLSEKLSS